MSTGTSGSLAALYPDASPWSRTGSLWCEAVGELVSGPAGRTGYSAAAFTASHRPKIAPAGLDVASPTCELAVPACDVALATYKLASAICNLASATCNLASAGLN